LSLLAGFAYDDYSLFSDAAVTSTSGWWQVWRPSQTRPLTYFTFWLNHAVGGRNPAGYHAVNLALHQAAVLLCFNVLSRLMPSKAAFLASAVFAIHPIQVEPVAYIFERATILATVLCLLAFRAWLAGHYRPACAWFAAALLAKEECAAFPLVLLLLEAARSRIAAPVIKPVAVMLCLAIAAGLRVIAVAAPPGSGAGFGASVSPLEYFATQGLVILRYFRLLLIPYGFTVDPDIPVVTDWQAYAAWIAILSAALPAWRAFPRVGAAFWFLAGLLLLLPSSSIFPIDDLAADRRMYLPLVGFGAAGGLALERLNPKLLAALGIVLFALTLARVQVWQNERSLWQEAVERAPNKVRPKLQLARVSDPPRAIELLNEAKRIAPENAAVASTLGSRYLAAGRTAEALAEFGRALALKPRDPLAFNNRGVALLALRQSAAARQDFERALSIDPCLFQARFNLVQLRVSTPAPPGCGYSDEQRRALAATAP
jgi:hypothetical protein